MISIRSLTKNLAHFTKKSLFTNRVCSRLSSSSLFDDCPLNSVTYEKVCSETLDGLTDYFEEILDSDSSLQATDVVYSDGVLTVNLGANNGIYVINRQSPNKQIWLSSPTTGPKRYDFVGPATAETGEWIYKHDGESLHSLLQKEVGKILKTDVDFFQLPYSKKL